MGVSSTVNAANLGVTYDQLMNGLDGFFPYMEPLREGERPGFRGISSLPGLYFIFGTKASVKEIAMMVPMCLDSPKAKTAVHIMIIQCCLKNAVPEWINESERETWVMKSLENLSKGAKPWNYSNCQGLDNEVVISKIYAEKEIKLKIIMGMIHLYINVL
jgi:hypothetical protein